MTNHEKLTKITGEEEPVEMEAVKMLLEKIHEDVEREAFEENFDKYPMMYRNLLEWLNGEAAKK